MPGQRSRPPCRGSENKIRMTSSDCYSVDIPIRIAWVKVQFVNNYSSPKGQPLGPVLQIAGANGGHGLYVLPALKGATYGCGKGMGWLGLSNPLGEYATTMVVNSATPGSPQEHMISHSPHPCQWLPFSNHLFGCWGPGIDQVVVRPTGKARSLVGIQSALPMSLCVRWFPQTEPAPIPPAPPASVLCRDPGASPSDALAWYPAPLTGLATALAASSAPDYCAILAAGGVACWGSKLKNPNW